MVLFRIILSHTNKSLFKLDSVGSCCAIFGEGSGTVHHLIDLSCSGSEYKLTDCYYKHIIHFNHNNDWSVMCNIGKVLFYLHESMYSRGLINDMPGLAVIPHRVIVILSTIRTLLV